MKNLNPQQSNSGVTLDRSAPIIQFDPWPFTETCIRVKDGYILRSDGELEYDTYWLLQDEHDNILAVATDGKPVVTSLSGLKALGIV